MNRLRARAFAPLALGLAVTACSRVGAPSAAGGSGGAAAAAAADPGPDAGRVVCALWRGKLGQREVAVSLRFAAGSAPVTGRYAYLHIGKAIPLVGTGTTAGLSLEERGAPVERQRALDADARPEHD